MSAGKYRRAQEGMNEPRVVRTSTSKYSRAQEGMNEPRAVRTSASKYRRVQGDMHKCRQVPTSPRSYERARASTNAPTWTRGNANKQWLVGRMRVGNCNQGRAETGASRTSMIVDAAGGASGVPMQYCTFSTNSSVTGHRTPQREENGRFVTSHNEVRRVGQKFCWPAAQQLLCAS